MAMWQSCVSLADSAGLIARIEAVLAAEHRFWLPPREQLWMIEHQLYEMEADMWARPTKGQTKFQPSTW